eukprot:403334851
MENQNMRAVIYLKNQILPKLLNNKEQSIELLVKINQQDILSLPRKISDHAALCIGRVLKKHSTLEEIGKFFESFISQNVCQALAHSPPQSLQFLRHSITIIKELSHAKLNAFKHAQWPLQLLQLPIQDMSIKSKILNLLHEILTFIELEQLLLISVELDKYFQQILHSDSSQIVSDVKNIKFVNSLCQLKCQLLNLVPIDKHNFQLFCNFIQYFYMIGFDSQLNKDLIAVYQNTNSFHDESVVQKAESILGYGVNFIKGLLDNPAIWTSDLIFSDRDPDSTGQAEEYLEKQFFTTETIQKILSQTVVNYLALTKEEIELWKEDSLKFFLYMKQYSNEVKGNLLREKAKSLLAGIQLRFGDQLDIFCRNVTEFVQKTVGSNDLNVQLEKEAMLQVLEIRLNDDTDIEIKYILDIIAGELRAPENLIVKRKIIQLLALVSDFDQVQKEQKLQEEFIREIMGIFASQQGDNNDLCLKMACVEYMKNFYNQTVFRVDAYAHFLGDVIAMCNSMIQSTYTKNTEILNEILELYRFIVEKYASHASQQKHIVQLVGFLKDIWEFFTVKQGELKNKGEDKNQEEEREEDEINIALQSIIRIMIHIISRIPLQELDLKLTLGVYEISLQMVFYSISTQNVILSEFTITLLLVLLRRLNNLDNDKQLSEGLKQLKHEILVNYQQQLIEILLTIPIQAEYDEEAYKYFILIEEILLSMEFIGGYQNQQLNVSLADFLKQSIQNKVTSDIDQLEDEEKITWVCLAAGTVSTLLLVKDYEIAKDLAAFLMSNDQFRKLILSQVNTSEDTSVILFAAYSLQTLPQSIMQTLDPSLIEDVSRVFKTHVESEVDSQLNYEFRLSRDLMEINDTEEEGLLFEVPDKTLIEAHHKEHVLNSWKDRELELIREATNSI